ncbi:MAG TPA: GIY-YIG nuclease family protein [Nocardioides sp.]|uniref:GIY-YIG nuclease family protein n=1 Tax=Nocardioides sp. TaxID=35761 RepID=UPI002F411293
MAWVYILECSDGSFYVGSTTDLERRLGQHQDGEGAEYTKPRRPVRLVWSLPFDRVDEAYAYEKRVQGWGRSKRLALIEGRADELPSLASRSHEALVRRQSKAARPDDEGGRTPRPRDASVSKGP